MFTGKMNGAVWYLSIYLSYSQQTAAHCKKISSSITSIMNNTTEATNQPTTYISSMVGDITTLAQLPQRIRIFFRLRRDIDSVTQSREKQNKGMVKITNRIPNGDRHNGKNDGNNAYVLNSKTRPSECQR